MKIAQEKDCIGWLDKSVPIVNQAIIMALDRLKATRLHDPCSVVIKVRVRDEPKAVFRPFERE